MRLNCLTTFSLAAGVSFAVAMLGHPSLEGANRTWGGVSSDLLVATNWSPNFVPTSADTAIFTSGASSFTPFANGPAALIVGTLTINSGQYNFSFTGTLGGIAFESSTSGNGLLNPSGLTQIFNINTNSALQFNNATRVNSLPVTLNVNNGGSLRFFSNIGVPANTATIDVVSGGLVQIEGHSTLGSSLLTSSGTVSYTAPSSAGASQQTINNAGTLTFGSSGGGDTSSGGTSTIIMNNTSVLTFQANTTASSANITLNAGTTGNFLDTSTAGTSTINMNGSSLSFVATASGGSSALNLASNSQMTMAGNQTFGSISSDSTSSVVANQALSSLTVGSNNASTTMAGPITLSGAGSLSFDKVGTGTLIVSNTDSFVNVNNGITVTAGSLQVDSFSLANQNVTDNSTLIFNQTTDGTYSGLVTGTGALDKIGSATLDIIGNNIAFLGSTSVNAGNLKVNGSLGGTVSVNSGGILSGTGLLNNVIINSGGTMAPGNSIGTLFLNGNYTQNPNSFYAVQINEAGQSTLIDATGTATLNGGTVQVTAIGPITSAQQYTILHAAGGVNGTFSGVTFSSAILTPSLLYDANDVFLKLALSFAPVVSTKNQANVAFQLENLFRDTPDPTQLAFLNTLIPLSTSELDRVLDLLSGEQYTSMLEIGRYANRRFLRQLYNPLRYDFYPRECGCECDCIDDSNEGYEIWTDVQGGRAFFEGNENASGFNAYNYDASLGIQTRLCEDWLVGAAAGYEYDHLKYTLAGHGRVHTAQGALYAAFNQPEYYAFSDLIGGWSDFKVVRPIQYSTNDMTAFGNTHLYHATLYTETGLNFDWDCLIIQPFAGFDVSYYRFNGVHERGTGVVDLDIRGKSIVDADTYLGAHFLTTLPQDFIWNADLAWVHRFFNRDHLITVNFQGFGDEFSISGINEGQNGFEGAVSLAKTYCDSLTVYAEFSGEVWSHATNYEGTIGLLAEW